MPGPAMPSPEAVIAATRGWIERAVIGLNLCPFARSVYVKERIRYVVTDTDAPERLAELLAQELLALRDTPAEAVDTTLLIHPRALVDFVEFNAFLDTADAVVEQLELDGVLQVASFHPDYQFADTQADDITNCTNRSPYPTLHLLRESSIDAAVEAVPDAESIYLRNLETLRRLGADGWNALGVDPRRHPR